MTLGPLQPFDDFRMGFVDMTVWHTQLYPP
ncbi:hypothetical protein FHR88_006073 [Bradyrhizobium betae]|nr:hypothetical protein [Bradyrhizobium betae]